MKIKIAFTLLVWILAGGRSAAQSNSDLRQVTLDYLSLSTWESRSSVSFQTGKLQYQRSEPYTDFDVTYGGMSVEKDGMFYPDWIRVVDSRSMMVDLGEKEWAAFKETPPFPQPKYQHPPLPLTNRPIVVDVSGDSREVSPYRQVIEVKTAHMYLARVSHGNKVFYVMFRVESLSSQQSCVLSFKLVKPPNVDDEK